MRPSRSRLRTGARAFAVLGATLSLPGASVLSRIGRRPASFETSVAGIPTTVVPPARAAPWPALVFMNGATPDGRSHPTVQRLGNALARAGVCVYVPDLAGVAGGELSPRTLAQSIAVSDAVSSLPESAAGRVALVGVSVGATLALLTAADGQLRRRISVVAGVAPFADLAEVMRLATTGVYRDGERDLHHVAPPYLRVGLARSLAAMLEETAATNRLCRELRALDPAQGGSTELHPGAFHRAGEDAERLYDLLANDDPDRFDELYAALPAHVLEAVASLSPIHAVHRMRAPVEIAISSRDTYFPVAAAKALAAASPRVRVTVTPLLAHATPRVDAHTVADLRRLYAFFTRALEAAMRPTRLSTME